MDFNSENILTQLDIQIKKSEELWSKHGLMDDHGKLTAYKFMKDLFKKSLKKVNVITCEECKVNMVEVTNMVCPKCLTYELTTVEQMTDFIKKVEEEEEK